MYNPFDDINLGGNIAVELIHSEPLRLEQHTNQLFEGGGVYALYYVGRCPIYSPYYFANVKRWGEPRALFPVYVGSSFAVGTKNGLQGARNLNRTSYALAKRIGKHRTKIKQCGGFYALDARDFLYRALPLYDAHIGLAEAALITFFRPVWNGTGFGSNVPGAGRPGAEGPNLWPYFHKSPSPTINVDADRIAHSRSIRDMRNRIKNQISQVSNPDSDQRIEKFMDLIRTKMQL